MSQAIQQGGNGSAKSFVQTVGDLFEKRKAAIAAVLPEHLKPERLIKVALNCIAKTPLLQKCTPASLVQCLVQAAELGLEPGGALGHAYLVPFKNKDGTYNCTLIIGYRGFIELARRTGTLAQIEAHVVYEKDEFKIAFGMQPELRHVPTLTGDRGNPKLVYMIARLKDGSIHAETMTIADIARIQGRSKSGDYGPWKTDWEEMAKKTVVRRGMKYLPMSAELAAALEKDDEDYVDGEVIRNQLASDNAIAEAITTPQTGNDKAKAAVAGAKKPIPIIDETGGDDVPPPNDGDAPEPGSDG